MRKKRQARQAEQAELRRWAFIGHRAHDWATSSPGRLSGTFPGTGDQLAVILAAMGYEVEIRSFGGDFLSAQRTATTTKEQQTNAV